MNTKLMTAAGALLLLATAAITPSALGHDDLFLCPPDHTPGGGSTVDDNPPGVNLSGNKVGCGAQGSKGHRYPLTYGGNHVEHGVAGRYVGSAGPAYAPDAYNFPQDTIAAGSILCDAEVVVVANNDPSNEVVVDGSPTAGNQPDGTWDDGGLGGACHTNSYTVNKFNTPGCNVVQPGDLVGPRSVRGTNVAGGELWVAAACDWRSTLGGTGPVPTFLLCVVNNVLGQNVNGLVGCVFTLVDCLTDIAGNACVTGGTFVCGANGSADDIDFGYSWGTGNQFAHFPNQGALPVGCPQAAATESIFVFDTVTTMGCTHTDPDGPGPLPSVCVPNAGTTVNVYPALTGQVWTVTP